MNKLIFIFLFAGTLCSAQVIVKVKHKRYTAAYNTQLMYPVLVTWTITAANVCKKGTAGYVNRDSSTFEPDPIIPQQTDLKKYYKSATLNPHKYQQGHNCPANDNTCNKKQMDECHYYSNMTPQNGNLNEHRWAFLEKHASDLAVAHNTVQVWCGAYGETEKMGPVSVPQYCWKIIKYGATEEVYIFPNTDTVMRHPWQYYKQPNVAGATTIRQKTGLILAGL
jgi:DNA/RNA endonuclease G (NUC1)